MWRFRLTISSYVLSLNRANEYTWTSELRYHINFKWSVIDSSCETSTWIINNFINNVSQLNFVGKHNSIEWNRVGYALELEEDLSLLLYTLGEYVKFVVDLKTEKVIFGSINSRNYGEM